MCVVTHTPKIETFLDIQLSRSGWWRVLKPKSIKDRYHNSNLYVCTQSRSCVQLFATPCSPPASSLHGISQARILKWFTISFSRRSSTQALNLHFLCHFHCRWILYLWAIGEARNSNKHAKFSLCQIVCWPEPPHGLSRMYELLGYIPHFLYGITAISSRASLNTWDRSNSPFTDFPWNCSFISPFL